MTTDAVQCAVLRHHLLPPCGAPRLPARDASPVRGPADGAKVMMRYDVSGLPEHRASRRLQPGSPLWDLPDRVRVAAERRRLLRHPARAKATNACRPISTGSSAAAP